MPGEPPRACSPGAPANSNADDARLAIIYEDSDLLVVNKPADLVCHPTKGDLYSSLISRVRLYLGTGSQPQLTNRLDRETSGVTLVALNASAARELRLLWELRHVRKTYLAIVHGHLPSESGLIREPIGKDQVSKVAIKDCVRADGLPAMTEYRVLKRFLHSVEGTPEPQPFSLVEVHPLTGRKHQIRIHLAHLRFPIVGDKIYGGDETAYLAFVEGRLTAEHRKKLILPWHALHASSLQFSWRDRDWSFSAEPEDWFTAFSLSR